MVSLSVTVAQQMVSLSEGICANGIPRGYRKLPKLRKHRDRESGQSVGRVKDVLVVVYRPIVHLRWGQEAG